jgi:adenosylcobinamide-GDP ribazoletransferase
MTRSFLFAWQFLTAIPLSRAHHEPAPAELADSMAWYPVVGALLGGLLAVMDYTLANWLPREIVAVFLILLLVAMTRGLHQDGLADMLDGLAGGRNPTDRLAIMRDSRIGSIGATGLFLSLIARYAAYVSLPDAIRWQAFLCGPALGRWAMVSGAYGARYARAEGGLAGPFLAYLSAKHLIGATLVISILLFSLFGVFSAAVILSLGLGISRCLTSWFDRMLGGITGDTIGAGNEVVELLFLLLIPLSSRLS